MGAANITQPKKNTKHVLTCPITWKDTAENLKCFWKDVVSFCMGNSQGMYWDYCVRSSYRDGEESRTESHETRTKWFTKFALKGELDFAG